jgi:hypothetical protein
MLQIDSSVTFVCTVKHGGNDSRADRGDTGKIVDAAEKEGVKQYRVELANGKCLTCLGASIVLSEVFQHLSDEEDDPVAYNSDEEFTDEVTVVAAFFEADADAVTISMQWSKLEDGVSTWDNASITNQVVGNTDLDCSHEALNLDGDMVGKKIRVYWLKEKQWFHAAIKCYERCTCKKKKGNKKKLTMESELHHHIVYKDGDEEWLNLLEPSNGSPAWEVEPFTEDRFDF